jgi:hypothetical protein
MFEWIWNTIYYTDDLSEREQIINYTTQLTTKTRRRKEELRER